MHRLRRHASILAGMPVKYRSVFATLVAAGRSKWRAKVAKMLRLLRALGEDAVRMALRRLALARTRGIPEAFHRLYYEHGVVAGGTWKATRWCGIETWKTPWDLWVYQEILWELRPSLIIECGTNMGGSALYLAQVCDAIGQGHVVSIDIVHRDGRPQHPRITYLLGSSVEPDIVAKVRSRIGPADTVLAILDSDHRADHVVAECRAYGPLVTPGSYLIVEDTNLNGHPVFPEHGPGPAEAVAQFLREAPAFASDHHREKFLVSFNPGGFLRRRVD
jgi:cephalosporin hydroxylase